MSREEANLFRRREPKGRESHRREARWCQAANAELVLDALTDKQLKDVQGKDQVRWFRQVEPSKYEELSASDPQYPRANTQR